MTERKKKVVGGGEAGGKDGKKNKQEIPAEAFSA